MAVSRWEREKKSQGLQFSALKPDLSEFIKWPGRWNVIVFNLMQLWSTHAVDAVANNRLTSIISGKVIVTPMGNLVEQINFAAGTSPNTRA
jgi:hypothetical protein